MGKGTEARAFPLCLWPASCGVPAGKGHLPLPHTELAGQPVHVLFSHSLQKACSPQSHGPLASPLGTSLREGRAGRGRAGPRLAHCGQPPCSVDWRFSCLAPCGPDSPNTSLQGERAPAQTRTHSLSSLRLRARAQGEGKGREQKSRCRAPGCGSRSQNRAGRVLSQRRGNADRGRSIHWAPGRGRAEMEEKKPAQKKGREAG